MYTITDDYGTHQTAWTLRGAMAWLPYCGPHAVIYNRITLRVVAARFIHRIGE